MLTFCRSRKEYLALLRNDLMNYYSYSEFMIDKLMDMFPLSEVYHCFIDINLHPLTFFEIILV